MRPRPKTTVLTALLLFILLPIAARATFHALEDRPASWGRADWSSTGSLPPAAEYPEARILVMSARTGRWKGIFATHSWIVIKRPNATTWNRYDVVGWGSPVRTNGWAPDGRWFSNQPEAVVDVRGAAAEALIPRIEAAIKAYGYAKMGDYRVWPGPNSNTFVASILRAVPELGATLPPTAVGKDFREWAYLGLTDSRTGVEANLGGLIGVKLGWVEGVELNFLTLVTGLDLRHPALKVPGIGRLGLDNTVALAAPAAR